MKYRSEIDGLRALAVIPVILFHAGFAGFSGGFVGVDVFFVISGYLITTILIEDIKNDRFSLLNFYERRARRILPALFLVMLACIPFAWFWMLPDPLENFGQSIVATTLFANNILLLITSGYWDLASEFKPLLHTWSLGVEEQYYLFFPLFLLLVWRIGRSRAFWVILAIAILSFALSEWSWRTDASFNLNASWRRSYAEANFYLIITRAWELFAGSIAAFIVQKRGVQGNNGLSMLGLLAIFIAVFAYNESTPFPSVYALLPVVGVALLVLYADRQTIAAKLLSNKLLVGIGLISYSAYLWHYPLMSFAKIYSSSEPSLFVNGALVLVTFLLSYFSWKYVEYPFRRRETVSTSTFAFITLSIGVGLVAFGYAAHKSHGFSSRVFDPENTKASEMSISYNERNFEFKRDRFKASPELKLLVVGNSVGRDAVNVLRETYDIYQIDLIYRDDLSDCSILGEDIGRRLFEQADIVLFASNYNAENPVCIETLLSRSTLTNTHVYFIGTKHFGYNLNWIARIDRDKRGLLRNELLTETIEAESLTQRIIPPGNFISLLDGLANENNEVLVTDEIGRLISGDRVHLTRYGAIFVGREIFLPSGLTSYLSLEADNLVDQNLYQEQASPDYRKSSEEIHLSNSP